MRACTVRITCSDGASFDVDYFVFRCIFVVVVVVVVVVVDIVSEERRLYIFEL